MKINEEHFERILELNSKLDSIHPFLIDPETIQFVKNSKILFINRGLPGSGKSTISKSIQQLYGKENTEICEGDQFFTNENGVYKYIRDKIDECRLYTQNRVRDACKQGKNCVIADDAHLTYDEVEPLIQIAKEHQYIVLLIEPRTPHKFDVDELFKKCKHNVSKPTINKKLQDFDLLVPRFYGWYLNETDSKNVIDLAKRCLDEGYVKDCRISEFKTELHCTSKFIGSESNSFQDYVFSLDVNQSLGKVFVLEIVGFSLSNRSLAADVKVKKSWNLWSNDLNEEEREEVVQDLDGEICFDGLKFGARAHLTIGLEQGLKAYKSGIDLIRVKLLKKCSKFKKFDSNMFDVFYLGGDYCYFKLKNFIQVTGIFTGQY